jgi:hypothetical protein
LAAPAIVPVIMIARITSIWRSVSMIGAFPRPLLAGSGGEGGPAVKRSEAPGHERHRPH